MKSLLEKYELNLTKRMLVNHRLDTERNLSRAGEGGSPAQAMLRGNLGPEV